MYVGPWQEYRIMRYMEGMREDKKLLEDQETLRRAQLEEQEQREAPVLPRALTRNKGPARSRMDAYRQGLIPVAALEPADFIFSSSDGVMKDATGAVVWSELPPIEPSRVDGAGMGLRASVRLCEHVSSATATGDMAGNSSRTVRKSAARLASLWPSQQRVATVPAPSTARSSNNGNSNHAGAAHLEHQVERRLRLQALYTYSQNDLSLPPQAPKSSRNHNNNNNNNSNIRELDGTQQLSTTWTAIEGSPETMGECIASTSAGLAAGHESDDDQPAVYRGAVPPAADEDIDTLLAWANELDFNAIDSMV